MSNQSYLFYNNKGQYLFGGSNKVFSNLYTPITNLIAASSTAGVITLTWSGGQQTGSYSYELSSGSIQSTSGTNPTTITLTSTNSVTTTVTLTLNALGSNYIFTSNSITTPGPPPDILWLKGNSTTYSGSGSVITNSASSGAAYNCNYWSVNGTLIVDTFGGGPVLKFVSTNSYFMVTSPVLPIPSNDVVGKGFTICFWFYPITFGPNGSRLISLAPVGNTSSTTENGYNGVFTIWNTADRTTLVFVNEGSTAYTHDANAAGSWYHLAYTSIVVTANSTTAGSASTKLYRNGVSLDISTGGAKLNSNMTPTTNYNFALAYGSSMYYSDIRIYGKELSSTEISAIYTGGRPTS
uniref:Uncharacterized protein n=1 Tax=viral metagenome TaxID=1070528 RepID=A0A6C0HSI0_9ZZZZ